MIRLSSSIISQLMITEDEITMYICSYALFFEGNAKEMTLFYDKIFSLTFP